MTIPLLLSSIAQKLDVFPFPEEVADGEAGACVAADIRSCVFNGCQMTPCV